MLLHCPILLKNWVENEPMPLSLIIGGLGLLSIYIMPDKNWLILSMIGVGIAWASILAMPYAILAGQYLQKKWAYIWVFLISL